MAVGKPDRERIPTVFVLPPWYGGLGNATFWYGWCLDVFGYEGNFFNMVPGEILAIFGMEVIFSQIWYGD